MAPYGRCSPPPALQHRCGGAFWWSARPLFRQQKSAAILLDHPAVNVQDDSVVEIGSVAILEDFAEARIPAARFLVVLPNPALDRLQSGWLGQIFEPSGKRSTLSGRPAIAVRNECAPSSVTIQMNGRSRRSRSSISRIASFGSRWLIASVSTRAFSSSSGSEWKAFTIR